MSGTGLPLVASSIGSLAVGGGSADVQPGVSSWVGSVGKKWEEIQRGSTYVISTSFLFVVPIDLTKHDTGRFTKSQKRASVLFSDVSHSIASALSSAPPSALASASYSPTPVFRAQSLSSGSGSGTSSRATSQSTTPLQTSSSLLDEDYDDDETTAHAGKLGAVMQPDLPANLLQPTNASVSVKDGRGGGNGRGVVQMLDDDEEWGW